MNLLRRTQSLLLLLFISMQTATAQPKVEAKALPAAPRFEELAPEQQDAFVKMDSHARQWAKNITGEDLDGTVASLSLLERILVDIREGYLKQGAAVNTQQLETICLAFGTYVGEVFRREVNGKWGRSIIEGGAPESAIRAPGASQITLLPMRRVCDRITEGPVKNVHEYVAAAVALARAP